MSNDLKRISISAIFSIISLVVSIGVGLYVYRYLWRNLTPSEFASWFIIFEISQFLLLFDFGYSHKFIANNNKLFDSTFTLRLNGLRFILLISSVFALLLLLTIIIITNDNSYRLRISYIFLGLSLVFTLLSYAETAALRLLLKNNQIYIIAISSQILFLVLLLVFSSNPPLSIGLAVFGRSFFLYLSQIYVLNQKYYPKWSSKSYFGGSVVAINLVYFLLFMLDAFMFKISSLDVVLITTLLVTKKYFDLMRALWDSILPNLYTRFADGNDKFIYLLFIILCGSSYLLSAFVAGSIIPLWLGDYNINYKLCIAFAVSFFGITILRVYSIRMFYKKNLNWKVICLFAISIKLLFFLLLYIKLIDIEYIYLIQGILLLLVVYLLERINRKSIF